MSVTQYESGPLHIEEDRQEKGIVVRWFGKSIARDPGEFLLPILSRALTSSANLDEGLTLDFTEAEYLNSSTITPIIRVLEWAKQGGNRVTVLYRQDLRWQALNFTALEVFHTGAQHIEIRGV